MRNNTKLKHLLLKYTVSFDMDDDGQFRLVLTDKKSNATHIFDGTSYAIVLSKAHSFLLQELKNEIN